MDPAYYLRMHEDTQRGTLDVDSPYVEPAAEVFALLADATRIRIILALRAGELSVNELAEIVGRPATAVSQHLAKLRWGRVVRSRQHGTRVYYSLVDEHARRLVADALFQAQHVVDAEPAHHVGRHPAPARPEITADPRADATAPDATADVTVEVAR